MTLTSTIAAIAMAFGAPLVYADQARNIIQRRNAEGFSKDVCAVLLIANICRCFFWLGERFEFALLLQSVLMIAAQIFLLSLLVKFRPGSFASSTYSVSSADQPTANANLAPTTSSSRVQFSVDVIPPTPEDTEGPTKPWKNSVGGYKPLLDNLNLPPPPILGYQDGEEEEEREREQATSAYGKVQSIAMKATRIVKAGFRMGDQKRLDGSSGSRPFGFWTWQSMSSYLIFLLILVIFLGILQLLLGSFRTYVSLLGFFALGLESTLPIPQAIANQNRRSLSGFRVSVLAGWLCGDLFKTIYFLAQGSPLQFTVCALFQLSVDFVIVAQMYYFRDKTAEDDENQRLSEAEALEAGQGRAGQESDASLEESPSAPLHSSSSAANSRFRIEADDDDDVK